MRLFKVVILFAAAWLLLSVVMSGCTCIVHNYQYQTPGPVFVSVPVPKPKTEIISEQPSDSYVWIEGRWDWNEVEKDWEWIEGSWVEPPTEDTQWKKPSYKKNNGDYVYTPGHWVISSQNVEDDSYEFPIIKEDSGVVQVEDEHRDDVGDGSSSKLKTTEKINQEHQSSTEGNAANKEEKKESDDNGYSVPKPETGKPKQSKFPKLPGTSIKKNGEKGKKEISVVKTAR